MSIFFRFILLSLSRGCLAHPVGTHSPRLYFYREPISHLLSVGNHPLFLGSFGCRSTCFPLGNHSSYPSGTILRILTIKQAVHRCRFVSFTHHKSTTAVGIFWLEGYQQPFGANGWNRTTGLPLMRRTFLPSELHGHMYAPYMSVEALAGFLLLLPKSSAHN